MSGDEGDGGEIGWKGGRNNEQQGMINRNGMRVDREVYW